MKFVKNLVNTTTDTNGRITIKFFICNRVIEVFKCIFDIVCSVLHNNSRPFVCLVDYKVSIVFKFLESFMFFKGEVVGYFVCSENTRYF